MANKTHWKKVVSDPIYLGEADFQEGEEKTATIDHVVEAEEFMTADGKKVKAVAHFREELKPLILNATNCKNITKALGSPFFEDWVGQTIQLYIDPKVKAFGDIVSAVRVRPRKPVIKQTVKCADCGGDILPASGKGADYIAQYTKRKFGVALCFACASKRGSANAPQTAQEAQEGGVNDGKTQAD